MKTIGLIGGVSWLSTVTYYELLNKGIQAKLGGLHSAKIILYSVNFDEIARLQKQNEWQKLNIIMLDIAKILQKAGADFILIGSNTMHKCFDFVEKESSIRLLHVSDATGEEIVKKGIKKIGLLGTKFTMEQDFIQQRLQEKYNLEVFIPQDKERDIIHDNIFNELAQGIFKKETKKIYLDIINRMATEEKCEGFILGCTEIPLIVKAEDTPHLLFDTAFLHASKAVEITLEK